MNKRSRYRPWLRCFTLATGLLLAATALANDQVSDLVSHFVSYPLNKQQYLEVRSEFPVTLLETEVIMPNWTPGSYTIKNFGANVDRLSATSESESRQRPILRSSL